MENKQYNNDGIKIQGKQHVSVLAIYFLVLDHHKFKCSNFTGMLLNDSDKETLFTCNIG